MSLFKDWEVPTFVGMTNLVGIRRFQPPLELKCGSLSFSCAIHSYEKQDRVK
jgi:hypothetical protein